jgi:hypothetical protein
MINEDGLDIEKLREYSRELTHEITHLITYKERSKEMTCAAIMSLSTMLVMVTKIVMPDKDKALDIITAAISRAMAQAAHRDIRKELEKEILVYEISTDPTTPGE